MTTENLGNQILTWDYKSRAKGETFNRAFYPIVKPGVYRGLEVSIATGNKINVDPGHAFLNCEFESQSVRGTSVHFQTAIVDLEIPQTNPAQNELVYLLYEYKQVTENYVDFQHIASGSSLPANAVVLCELTYDGSGNITGILYERKTWGLYDSTNDYSLPDIGLKLSNYSDKTKKFRFSASNVTSGQTRILGVPDYDYNIGTIDDWQASRKYSEKETIVFNSTIYRCNTTHTSSPSFYTDISNWDNITQIQDEERTRGFNDTGSTLTSGLVVTISGDAPSEEIPEISAISAYDQEPYGIVIQNILNGESGEVIQRGRLVVPSLDTSGAVVGQKLYSDSSGALTLAVTPLAVGQVITPAVSDSVIYVGILPTEEGINPINFNGQLSTAEDTIQKAFDRLDDYGYIPDWETAQNYRVGNSVVRVDDGSDSIWTCVSGHTSSVFSVDIANWKPTKLNDPRDLISSDSNIGVTGGVNSTLQDVIIKLSDNPVVNSINSIEINITNFKLISASGNLDDVDIEGFSIVKFDSASVVTGLVKPNTASRFKQLTITNVSASNITIADESLDSDLENRILTGQAANIELAPDASLNLYYDYSSMIWRVVGGTGSGSTGGGGSDGLVYSPSVLTANLKAGQYNDWTLLLADLSSLAVPKVIFTESCSIPCGEYYDYEFVSVLPRRSYGFGTTSAIVVTLTGSLTDNLIPKKMENIRYNLSGLSGTCTIENGNYYLVNSSINTLSYTLDINCNSSLFTTLYLYLENSLISDSSGGSGGIFFDTSNLVTLTIQSEGRSSIGDGNFSGFSSINISTVGAQNQDSVRTDEVLFPVIGSVTKSNGGADPVFSRSGSYPKIRKFYHAVTVATDTFTLPIKGTEESVIAFVDGSIQFENFGVTGTSLVFDSVIDIGSVVNGWVISL